MQDCETGKEGRDLSLRSRNTPTK